jgi:hypothetical protein
MPRQIKIHQTVAVYSDHDESSKTSNFLSEGQIVEFNREKRRNGINWMEIYIDAKKVYIKKDFSKMYIIREAKLSDDSCTVLFFESKDGRGSEFAEVFSATQNEDKSLEEIPMRRVYEGGNKEKYVNLYFDKNTVDVSKTVLAKGDPIMITAERKPFLEIQYGKKTGYLLYDVSYSEIKDWWVMPVIFLIIAAITIGIFVAIYETGWIVVGPILLIPGFIVALIVIVFMQLIIAVLNAIFHNLRKRL